jgi:phage-related protein
MVYYPMPWHVEITEEAKAEIQRLPADMRAHFLRIAQMLEDFGPQKVTKPHVDHLEGKLWEIRMHGQDGIARAIYFAAQGQQLIVVHAFQKKTQKTPRRDIELAFTRMQGWLHDETQRLSARRTGRPPR